MIPKTLGIILCELMRQCWDFFKGLNPVTCGVKLTQHFINRTSHQQSDVVVVV